MPYASFTDVQARWFEDLTEQRTVIETRLADAELLIRTRIPDLGSCPDGMVVLVECEMTLRLIRNPEGYMQESDGGYSYMLNQRIASGELDVLPRECRGSAKSLMIGFDLQ